MSPNHSVESAPDLLPEGSQGTLVTYQERLWAAWWVWLLVLGIATMIGVAYGAALNTGIGWLMFAVLLAVGWGALAFTTPLIRVDDVAFRAGRARLPLRFLGEVRVLTPDVLEDVHRATDASAYLLLRRWAAPAAVGVVVADQRDPHPYWLVSTRSPDALAAALRSAQDNAHGT